MAEAREREEDGGKALEALSRPREEKNPKEPSGRASAGERVAQRRKMAKREGPSTSRPRPRSKATKEGHDAREVENGQRLLEKLPPEVWEKILDHLGENDLFPLALSCRYFRQKQKELVARDVLNKRCIDRRALRTSLKQPLWWPPYLSRDPVSAEYPRFCSKEEASMDAAQKRNCLGYPVREWSLSWRINCLAAFHGYLPLLQQLQAASEGFHSKNFPEKIFQSAGESSPLLFFHFLLCFGD